MARLHEPTDEYRHGKLLLESLSSTCVEVFYVPSQQKLEQFGLNAHDAALPRVKLLEINGEIPDIKLFPINMRENSDEFLEPKYKQIEHITLEGNKTVYFPDNSDISSTSDKIFMATSFGPKEPLEEDLDLESIAVVPSTQNEVERIIANLPAGFTKNYEHGLALSERYNLIIDAVEELTQCTGIVISDYGETQINEIDNVFHISFSDFEAVRKSIDKNRARSQKDARAVNESLTYNLFAKRIGQPEKPIKIGRHWFQRLLMNASESQEPLSKNEEELVLNAITKNVKSIAETKAEKLAKLEDDIELVKLDTLIARYERMLTKTHQEYSWQRFLKENSFALSLVFGYPIIKVQEQASVGGRKLWGRGGKIADFVFKNTLTNNVAIIEIKTPQEKLLNKRTYRGGVHSPSDKLSGAINQALDQKYQFEREIAQIKENSRVHDIETYSIHCGLIIGTMPTDIDQKKSFEFFRGNSKNVEIVTFDELLEKIKELRDFLSPSSIDSEIRLEDDDLPF